MPGADKGGGIGQGASSDQLEDLARSSHRTQKKKKKD